MKHIILLAIALCLFTACHRGAVKESTEPSSIENKVNFDANVDGLDDPLETDVKITSGSISIWKWKFAGNGDQRFLRGYINKATLAPTYQLYVEIRDFSWRHWDTARYVTSAGVKEVPLVSVGKNVECSRYCIHSEDMILPLDRATLEAWRQGNTKVRIASTSVGGTVDIEVDKDDLVNYLNAMDQVSDYLAKQKRPPKGP